MIIGGTLPVGQLRVAALQGLIEELREGLILADFSGQLHWNRAALAMYNLGGSAVPSQPLPRMRMFFQLETLNGAVVPPDDWPLARTLRGETVRDVVLRVRRLDCAFERVFSYDGSLVLDESGRPELAAMHVRDVTARVEVEQALARDTRRQALLLQCSRHLLDAQDNNEEAQIGAMMSQVAEFLDADPWLYHRLTVSQRRLHLVTGHGVPPLGQERVKSIALDDRFSYISRVAYLRQPLIADRDAIAQDPYGAFIRQLGLRCYAGFPLVTPSGEVIGTMSFASRRHDRFAAEDVRMIQTLSHMVASAVERSETELSLRRSEASLRELAESMRERDALLNVVLDQLPLVVWRTDRDLRITAVRGAAMGKLHMTSDQLVGRLVADLDVPNRAPSVERHRAALAGRQVIFDAERLGFSLHGVLAPLYEISGEVGGVVGMVVDVSDRSRTERALREAAENMAVAQRIAHFGSWEVTFGPDGQPNDPAYWSEELFRIHGLDPVPGGMPLARVSATTHPEDVPRIDAIRNGLSAEHPEWTDRLRFVRPSGEVRHVRTHTRLFVDERTGRPLKLVGTTQDITEQQQAEDEIRRLNADLERRVAERTSELSAANAELESFAYAVAHDLRAPLRAMAGFGRALLEDYGERLDDEGRGFIGKVLEGSRKMGELIDALLSLSRHTRGELRREVVDLSALAERMLAGLSRGEPERRVDWSVSPGLAARGDPRMIEVVLQNLLGNAWKYSARVEVARITVQGEAQGPEVQVRVEDNGAGFSMDHAAKLFQPFQRLHRQDEFTGIGIGLATVQRIVRRHGGVIVAEGRPGQGARFSFSLPAASGGERAEGQ